MVGCPDDCASVLWRGRATDLTGGQSTWILPRLASPRLASPRLGERGVVIVFRVVRWVSRLLAALLVVGLVGVVELSLAEFAAASDRREVAEASARDLALQDAGSSDADGSGDSSTTRDSGVGGGAGTGLPDGVVPESSDPVVSEDVVVSGTRVETGESESRGVPTLIESETTERTRVFEFPDGSRRVEIASTPVRTLIGDTWVALDGTLVPKPDGGFGHRVGSTDVRVAVDEKIAARVPTSAGVISIRQPGAVAARSAAQLTDSLAIAPARSLVREDSAYGPGQDLLLEALPAGVKVSVEYATRSGDGSFVTSFEVPEGVAVRQAEAGLVEFVSADGEVFSVYGSGTAADSGAPEERSGQRPEAFVETEFVSQVGPVVTVRSFVPREWWDDPARVFPITIDPVFDVVDGLYGDTWVASSNYSGGNQTVSQYASTELRVGYANGAKHRSEILFDIDPELIPTANVRVLSASLHLTTIDSSSCTPHDVLVNGLSQWYGPYLTWAGQPPLDSYGPSAQAAYAYKSSCSAPNNNPDFAVDVWPTVDRWASGAQSNQGIRLSAGNEDDEYAFKKFHSNNASQVNDRPFLLVDYETYSGPHGASYGSATSWNRVPGRTTRIPVTIRNLGTATWPANSDYRLSYHLWQGVVTVQYDGVRTQFPQAVSPGEVITVNAVVDVPDNPGQYVIRWDVVYEPSSGGRWFSSPPPSPNPNGYVTVPEGFAALNVSPNPSFGHDPYSGEYHGVNLVVGNYTTSETDISLPVVGPALDLTRTYNSLDDRTDRPFGLGWRSTYDTFLTFDSPVVTLHHPDGRADTYSLAWDGKYYAPPGHSGNLVHSQQLAIWVLTDGKKKAFVFNEDGELLYLKDEKGLQLTITRSSGFDLIENEPSGRYFILLKSGNRVSEVVTPPVTGAGTELRWKYYYSGLRLDRVCAPGHDIATNGGDNKCTDYNYQSSSPWRLIRITRPEGNAPVKTIAYQSSGRVDYIDDADDKRYDYSYSQAGSTFYWTGTMVDPRGNSISATYDTNSRLIERVDQAGNTWTFTYNSAGRLYRAYRPGGTYTEYGYDAQGHKISERDPAGHTRYWLFDNGNLVEERDARSSGPTDNTYVVTHTYDADGNELSELRPAGGPNGTTDSPASWTVFAYFAGTEAAEGGGTVDKGLLKSERDPNGKTTYYQYRSNGDLFSIRKPTGTGAYLETQYVYDNLGRTTHEKVFALGAPGVELPLITQYEYNAAGQRTEIIEPLVYNQVATDPGDHFAHRRQTITTYDANGNPIEVRVEDNGDAGHRDATRISTSEYDLMDREWRVTDAEGGVLTRVFDDNGNVWKVTDQEGRITRTEHNSRNLPWKVWLNSYTGDPNNPVTPYSLLISETTYDALGRKDEVTDALGRVKRFQFLADDRLWKVTLLNYQMLDGSTRHVILENHQYDNAGNETSIARDWNTNGVSNTTVVMSKEYDYAGRVARETQTIGSGWRRTAFAYDPNNNVTRTRRTSSPATVTEELRQTFDDGNNVIQSVVENGTADLTSYFAYDLRGLKVEERDARSASGSDNTYRTQYKYDEAGRLIWISYPNVDINGTQTQTRSRVGYDNFGNPVQARTANWDVTETVYDKLDRRIEVRQPSYTPPGASAPLFTPNLAAGPTTPLCGAGVVCEKFVYDDAGNLIESTSRRGHRTTYLFDQFNRVAKQTDPDVGAWPGGTTQYAYDLMGNQTKVTNQVGAVTEFTYDMMNRVRTKDDVVRLVTGETGSTHHYVWSYDYDFLGNRTEMIAPDTGVTEWTYNEAGEVTSVKDPRNHTATYTYDLSGRLVRDTDQIGRYGVKAYDLAGRLLTVKRYNSANVLQTTTTYGYDAVGNQTSYKSPLNWTTTYTFDAKNQLTAVTVPVTGTTSITNQLRYDKHGNLTKITNGLAAPLTTNLSYNTWNLTETLDEPDVTAPDSATTDGTWTVRYDQGGLAVNETQPGGVTIARTFNELGLLTLEQATGSGITTGTRTFSWDVAGRRLSASHPNGTLTFEYDDRGLLANTAGPAGTTTARYDSMGQLTSRTDPAGTQTFTWTKRGELKTAHDSITDVTRNYTQNSAGELTAVTYNPAGGGTAPVRTYTYDALGRLDTDKLEHGTNTLSLRDYGYDNDDNLKTLDISSTVGTIADAGSHSYTYDRAERLTKWTKPNGTNITYTYDAAFNLTRNGSTYYCYDERNQLRAEYTTAGSCAAPDAAGKRYFWSPRGTLTQTVQGATTNTFSYDGLARLTASNPGGVGYTYDSLDRLVTRTASGAPAQNFTYSGQSIDPTSDGATTIARSPGGRILALAKGGQARLAETNRHGDLVGLFTPGGSMTDTAGFDPWGKPNGVTGTLNPGFGFQGDWTDASTGQVWMGARFYQPSGAYFLTRDTVMGELRTPVSLNRYTYAQNNPLRYWDPDGHYVMENGFTFNPGNKNSLQAFRRWNRTEKSRNRQAAARREAAEQREVNKRRWCRFNDCGNESTGRTAQSDNKPDTPEEIFYANLVVFDVAKTHDIADANGDINERDIKRILDPKNGWPKELQEAAQWALDTGAWKPFYTKKSTFDRVKGFVHGALDICGIVDPTGVCDTVNAAIYFAEGNYMDAALTMAGVIPGLGDSLKGLKYADEAVDAAKYVDEIGDGAKYLDDAADASSSYLDDVGACMVPGHSFSWDTEVLLADGSTKRISEVAVGDQVVASDPRRGPPEVRRVVQTHVTVHEDDLLDVTVAFDDRTDVIHTTDLHAFWSVTTGEWVPAQDLAVGERLRAFDGSLVEVRRLTEPAGPAAMWDLTVEGLHTFYAGESLDGVVLVHNEDDVHGNSRASTRPQHVYEIRDPSGGTEKYGISGQPLNQDGSSPRANRQVNSLNAGRSSADGLYTADVLQTDVPGRAAALGIEQDLVDEYASRHPLGDGPEGNKLPRPTSPSC